MDAKAIFDELVASSELRLLTLRRYLNELRATGFPPSGASDLILLSYRLTFFYETAIGDVSKAYSLFASRNAPAQVLRGLKSELVEIVKQIHEISKTSRYVETASYASISTDIPAILDNLAKTLNPSISVIVRPQNAYAYEYREVTAQLTKLPFKLLSPPAPGEVPFERLTQKWFRRESILNGLSAPLGVINYPKIEGSNILRHAFAVGHELGHFADEVLNIRKRRSFGDGEISELLEFRSADVSKLTEAVIRVAQARGDEASHLRTQIPKQITTRGLRWLAELVGDIASVCISGPAAVVSFLWLAFGESSLDFSYKDEQASGSPAQSYPWLRLRLRVMLDALDIAGFDAKKPANDKAWYGDDLPFLHKRLQLARELADEHVLQEFESVPRPELWDDKQRDSLDRFRTLEGVRIVTDAVQRILTLDGDSGTDLVKETRKRLESVKRGSTSPWLFSHDDCLREVPFLVSAIVKHEMPCQILAANQTPVPARFPSIVNAGWEAWLKRSSELLDPSLLAEYMFQLNGILAAAVEASQLHQRFLLERRRVSAT